MPGSIRLFAILSHVGSHLLGYLFGGKGRVFVFPEVLRRLNLDCSFPGVFFQMILNGKIWLAFLSEGPFGPHIPLKGSKPQRSLPTGMRKFGRRR